MVTLCWKALEKRLETLERETKRTQLDAVAQKIKNKFKFAGIEKNLEKLQNDIDEITDDFKKLSVY